jgi:steroid delta-isomerase-like uncharacterized protein
MLPFIKATLALTLFCTSLQLHAAGERLMPKSETKKTIEQFYQYFNAREMDNLYALIADNVTHQINYHDELAGKEAFKSYMVENQHYFQEFVTDPIFMFSEDGHHATIKFTVKGKYLITDASKIPAHGQSYELVALNYFEVNNGKIVKARCWYDENDWKRQVS